MEFAAREWPGTQYAARLAINGCIRYAAASKVVVFPKPLAFSNAAKCLGLERLLTSPTSQLDTKIDGENFDFVAFCFATWET